jgi:hypothetical protein
MMIPEGVQRLLKIPVCLAAEAPSGVENPVLKAMFLQEILGNPWRGQQLSMAVLRAFLLHVLVVSFADLQ